MVSVNLLLPYVVGVACLVGSSSGFAAGGMHRRLVRPRMLHPRSVAASSGSQAPSDEMCWSEIHDDSRAQAARVAAELASEIEVLTHYCTDGREDHRRDSQCQLFWDDEEEEQHGGSVPGMSIQSAISEKAESKDEPDFHALGKAISDSLSNLEILCHKDPNNPRCELLELDDQGPDHTVSLE